MYMLMIHRSINLTLISLQNSSLHTNRHLKHACWSRTIDSPHSPAKPSQAVIVSGLRRASIQLLKCNWKSFLISVFPLFPTSFPLSSPVDFISKITLPPMCFNTLVQSTRIPCFLTDVHNSVLAPPSYIYHTEAKEIFYNCKWLTSLWLKHLQWLHITIRIKI